MTAQEIRDLRGSLGMTQQQFADRLGCHRDTVQDWENGRRPGAKHEWRLQQLKKASLEAQALEEGMPWRKQ